MRSRRAIASIPTATPACCSDHDVDRHERCHAVVMNRSDERHDEPFTEEMPMLRVYRRQDDRLVPTDLDVTPHSLSAQATDESSLHLITPTRHEDQFAE